MKAQTKTHTEPLKWRKYDGINTAHDVRLARMQDRINEISLKKSDAEKEISLTRTLLINIRSRLPDTCPPWVYNELSTIIEPGN